MDLLTFKNGLIDEDGILSSWQSNECCRWNGVECNNTTRHVITLQLDDANLRGKIGSSLLELHHLNYLDLSRNDFGGILIPEFIGSMKQLQHLYLRSSNFSGIVPPQIGNLTNLRSLDLSYNSLKTENIDWLSSLVLESLEILDLSSNKLNGSIPDLSQFSSLTQMNLSANNFTGSIPLSIGQLSKLQLLDLSHNSLEGLVSESHFIKLDKLKTLDLSFNSLIFDIPLDWSPPFQLKSISLAGCNVGSYFPKWIRTQRNLSYLDLSSANITDEAPRWLWHSSSLLQNLYLYDNKISGIVPNLSSTSIEFMDLSYNHFSGSIPIFPANANVIYLSGNMFTGSISSICETHHHRLRYLLISHNKLSGDVPNCWENMPNLHTLHLANNSLSGEIPASFGNLQNFVSLKMHDNNLSGELPYNLRHCQELRFIDVGGNNLNGEIPAWIGQMYNMQYLILRGNKLHGSIPREICHLTNILVLDLSLNNLSSIIPDCFNNFTTLARKNATNLDIDCSGSIYLGFFSLHWKGHELEYRGNLGFLKLIDISSNRLVGNIPKSFAHLRGLKSLNLSRNSLTGHIIPDIGQMVILDSFDLSHNQLSGKIPTGLTEIYSLGFLDLSNNNLSGKIPTSTQLQSFDASSYANNHELCGDPLPKCPDDSLRPSTTNPGVNMNEKDGNNFSFMEEVGISMGFGFIFGFWGVVGLFILKKSWRIAFFTFLDVAGDWVYVRTSVFVSKWRSN
ncbi:receptor-like protein EIX2 [Salvia hispanica]|uniref:receptor-like protein EIX2 n=1 Tax=Salvia hispanica TaxID=49212 RepID=UPI002008F84A|nr:receptor-like protein EIX2 [Salvia hispanica]